MQPLTSRFSATICRTPPSRERGLLGLCCHLYGQQQRRHHREQQAPSATSFSANSTNTSVRMRNSDNTDPFRASFASNLGPGLSRRNNYYQSVRPCTCTCCNGVGNLFQYLVVEQANLSRCRGNTPRPPSHALRTSGMAALSR